jgi:ribosomal-protein-alanine N-acetyltransferase
MPDGAHEAIVIRTARLRLRPLEGADRDAHIAFMLANAEHLRRWQPAPPPGSTPESRFDRALERSREGVSSGRELRLFAFGRGPGIGADVEGPLVGWFNLNNVARGVFQNAYAGWALGADFVGRALATEGVHALLDVAFAPPPRGMGLHRVQANVMPVNDRSIGVARRCGLREEGLCRGYLEIAGRWEDHLMFGKLADEHEVGTAELPGRLPEALTR